MALQNTWGIILAIWVLGANANLNNMQCGKLTNNEVIGTWQLIKAVEDNRVIEDESFRECGLREEMEIWAHGTKVGEYSQYKMRAYTIGKTNYLICSINPGTYKFEITRNVCDDGIFQDLENKEKWYRIGEGAFVEYHASLVKGYLILEEKKNKHNTNPKKRILTFERKRN